MSRAPERVTEPRRTSVLRRVLHHPRVEPCVSAALRGRLVRQWLRFTARELRGAHSVHVYRIRASGLQVQIEHGSPDVLTLDQAFYQHAYEPPEPAIATLEGLGRPRRALDLGANIGMWALWLHGRFAVDHVTGVEPDPDNARRHRAQIALNRLDGSWQLLEAAATCSDGPVSFTTGRATTGRIGSAAEPDTATVDGIDAFSLLSDVDLLKIDIEGGEWALLADSRAGGLSVPVVMLEYHPHGAPSADPAADARRALVGAGYRTSLMHAVPDGTGVVWAWRPA